MPTYPWVEMPPMRAWNWVGLIAMMIAFSPVIFAAVARIHGRGSSLRNAPSWILCPLALIMLLGLFCMHPVAFLFWVWLAAGVLPALGAPAWASVILVLWAIACWLLAVWTLIAPTKTLASR